MVLVLPPLSAGRATARGNVGFHYAVSHATPHPLLRGKEDASIGVPGPVIMGHGDRRPS
jgi:hypothetical protein